MRNKQIKLKDTPFLHEKSDGLIYYENKPFTGRWGEDHKNGQYLNGKKHGVWIERSSQFVTTIFYDEGEILGAKESTTGSQLLYDLADIEKGK